MDAAIKLFDVQGFRNTTVEQIADCAGISKGLVYKYFKNKKGILLSYYNRFTVQGTAASRVFFRIVAKAVRMRESWPDVCLQGP